MTRVGFGLFLGVVVALVAGRRPRRAEEKNSTYTSLVDPLTLPIFLLTVTIAFTIALGSLSDAGRYLTGMLAGMIVYLSIYYLLLLCLLPLARRIFSPGACANLWILPTLMYYVVWVTWIYPQRSFFTVTISAGWLTAIIIIWFIGFAAVLIWQIAAHMAFRRRLLRDAENFTNWEAISRWNGMLKRYKIKREIPVLVSKNTATPLTIGCSFSTMRLVLPKTEYTDEELDLIFRHELTHIRAGDTRTKAFLGFCTALCWFYPVMWISRRRVSEDLELSCDEQALKYVDAAERRRYAELLLRTAGDARGFTTCLSAAASSMRYRLRGVMDPKRRLQGAVLLGVVIFLLVILAVPIVITAPQESLGDFMAGYGADELPVMSVSVDESPIGSRSFYGWEGEALKEYLCTLQVEEAVSPLGLFFDGKPALHVGFGDEYGPGEENVYLAIMGNVVRLGNPIPRIGHTFFILNEEPDWDYIASLLDFDAVDSDPAPRPPELMLHFDHEGANGEPLYAGRRIISQTRAGEPREVTLEDISGGGLHGAAPTSVELSFTYDPAEGYTVMVEGLDGEEPYTVVSSELSGDVLPLAPFSARYFVNGTFESTRETVYEVEFTFTVEYPEG